MRYHFIVSIGHGEDVRVKNVAIEAADFLDASDQVISAYPRASMILGTKPCRRGGARSLREVFERRREMMRRNLARYMELAGGIRKTAIRFLKAAYPEAAKILPEIDEPEIAEDAPVRAYRPS